MKTMRTFLHVSLALAVLGLCFSVTTPARAAGTTITVTSTSDNATVGNLAGNGTCDLREAVQVVNTNTTTGECTAGAAPYKIAFNIGTGLKTIGLASTLVVTAPVTIDGTTESDYSGAPRIDLDGGGTLSPLMQLLSGANGSTVKGLMFTNVAGATALVIGTTVDGVTVAANYFNTNGTSVAGTTAIGLGIGSSNDIIGGTTAADRNLFAGGSGIYQSAGSNDLIEGNYFGVQADGVTAISGQPTVDVALLIYTGGSNGGTVRNNVITGFGSGIELYTNVSHVTIAGNKIGVGADGSTALGNHVGIYLHGANTNTIGGTTAADRNIIAANTNSNIYADASGANHPDSNLIEGNYIGTNAAGTAAVGSPPFAGIDLEDGSGNQIGGSSAGAGNLISGQAYGIYTASTTTGTVVRGNRIGTNASGSAAIPNVYGVYLNGAPAVIGDSTTPGNNLISGNDDIGIYLGGAGSTGTTIFGNKVGINKAGSAYLPNGGGASAAFKTGIYLAGSGSIQVAQNWIGGNNTYGLFLASSALLTSGSDSNCLTGNGSYGAYSSNTGATAPLTGNWWGAADGPSSVGTGSGDHVSAHIDFSSFLTAAPAACSPAVSLSLSSLNFGSQLLGTASAVKSVTLTNTGPKVLTFTSILTSAPYSLTGSTCPLGSGTLGSGSSCLIKAKFSPTALGSVSHNVAITSDASTSPDHIALTGKGIAGTQLLKNPSFETDANHDNKPDNWSYTGFNAATDGRDCTVHQLGSCSLKLAGNGTQKAASETIMKSGVAGNDFTFALWSKASAVPAGAVYRLQVLFYNGTTLKATKTMNFAVGTHGFQKVSGTFTATSAYTKVIFKIIFKAASGTAWFDTSSLKWAP
jgi:hypothetical protein